MALFFPIAKNLMQMEVFVSGGAFTDSVALVIASESTGGIFFPVLVFGMVDLEQKNQQELHVVPWKGVSRHRRMHIR
jgi:hypothetical protein